MYKEVEIDLDEFDDDEIIDYVRYQYGNSGAFKAYINAIASNEIYGLRDELTEFLSEVAKIPNQTYAKEEFEKLEFSKDLVEWILKTYGGEK